MSGNNNYRSNAPWGVWGTFWETAFKKGEVTLASVVQDAGYCLQERALSDSAITSSSKPVPRKSSCIAELIGNS